MLLYWTFQKIVNKKYIRQHNLSKEEKQILLERAVSSGRIPGGRGR